MVIIIVMRRLLVFVLVALLLLSSACRAQLPTPDVEKIKSDIISWAQIGITVLAIIIIVAAIIKVGYGSFHLSAGLGAYAASRGWSEILEGIKGPLIFAIMLLLLIWLPSLLFGWGLVNQPLYNVLSDAVNKIFGGLKP
jgi:site-specific recombinase